MLLIFVLTVGACAQERPRVSKRWLISVAALAAANVMDAASSAGRQEANPLLRNQRGEFSAGRAAAFKISTSGTAVLLQYLLGRRRPQMYKMGALTNFVGAGVLAGTAVRNSR